MDANGTPTTNLARTTRHSAIQEWDEGFQRLVKATVLKPKDREATAAELALLAEQAVRTGLDPMSRQIYGIYRYDRRAGGQVMTIQVGIDGLRSVAQRTGQYAGGPAPLFAGPDGDWTDLWLHEAPPVAAKCIVRKVIDGTIIESESVALFREYVPMKDGKPTGLWGDKPALMIAKCAEALALRKAFPHDLSGLYTDDEMARADSPPRPLVTPAQVAQAVAPVAEIAAPDAEAPPEAEVIEPPPTTEPTPPPSVPVGVDPKTVKQLDDELNRFTKAGGEYDEVCLQAAALGGELDDGPDAPNLWHRLDKAQARDLFDFMYDWVQAQAAQAKA